MNSAARRFVCAFRRCYFASGRFVSTKAKKKSDVSVWKRPSGTGKHPVRAGSKTLQNTESNLDVRRWIAKNVQGKVLPVENVTALPASMDLLDPDHQVVRVQGRKLITKNVDSSATYKAVQSRITQKVLAPNVKVKSQQSFGPNNSNERPKGRPNSRRSAKHSSSRIGKPEYRTLDTQSKSSNVRSKTDIGRKPIDTGRIPRTTKNYSSMHMINYLQAENVVYSGNPTHPSQQKNEPLSGFRFHGLPRPDQLRMRNINQSKKMLTDPISQLYENLRIRSEKPTKDDERYVRAEGRKVQYLYSVRPEDVIAAGRTGNRSDMKNDFPAAETHQIQDRVSDEAQLPNRHETDSSHFVALPKADQALTQRRPEVYEEISETQYREPILSNVNNECDVDLNSNQTSITETDSAISDNKSALITGTEDSATSFVIDETSELLEYNDREFLSATLERVLRRGPATAGEESGDLNKFQSLESSAGKANGGDTNSDVASSHGDVRTDEWEESLIAADPPYKMSENMNKIDKDCLIVTEDRILRRNQSEIARSGESDTNNLHESHSNQAPISSNNQEGSQSPDRIDSGAEIPSTDYNVNSINLNENYYNAANDRVLSKSAAQDNVLESGDLDTGEVFEYPKSNEDVKTEIKPELGESRRGMPELYETKYEQGPDHYAAPIQPLEYQKVDCEHDNSPLVKQDESFANGPMQPASDQLENVNLKGVGIPSTSGQKFDGYFNSGDLKPNEDNMCSTERRTPSLSESGSGFGINSIRTNNKENGSGSVPGQQLFISDRESQSVDEIPEREKSLGCVAGRKTERKEFQISKTNDKTRFRSEIETYKEPICVGTILPQEKEIVRDGPSKQELRKGEHFTKQRMNQIPERTGTSPTVHIQPFIPQEVTCSGANTSFNIHPHSLNGECKIDDGSPNREFPRSSPAIVRETPGKRGMIRATQAQEQDNSSRKLIVPDSGKECVKTPMEGVDSVRKLDDLGFETSGVNVMDFLSRPFLLICEHPSKEAHCEIVNPEEPSRRITLNRDISSELLSIMKTHFRDRLRDDNENRRKPKNSSDDINPYRRRVLETEDSEKE